MTLENQIIDLRMQAMAPANIGKLLKIDYWKAIREVNNAKKRGIIFPTLLIGYNRPTAFLTKSRVKLHKVWHLVPRKEPQEELEGLQGFEYGKQTPTTDVTFILKAEGWKFHTSKSLGYIFNN